MSVVSLQSAIQKHQQGLLDEAGALYTQILQSEPDNVDALRLLSMLADEKGQWEQAIELARKAVQLAPRVSALYLTLANPLLAMGQVDEAIVAAKEGLQRDKRSFDVLLFLGDAHQQKQDYTTALEYYRKAQQLDRSVPELFNNQGNARLALGEFETAIGCYEKAIGLNPRYTDAHFNLGNAFRELTRYEEALAAYHKALECNPKFYKAYVMMGVVFRTVVQFSQAESCYQQALALMPANSPEAAVTLYNLGNLYLQKKDYDQAIPCYRNAVALTPEQGPETIAVLHNFANALFEQGRAEEAIQVYVRLAELCPDSAAYRINQALTLPVLYQNKDEVLQWRQRYEDAVDALLQAELPPMNAQFVEQLASTGFYLGYQGMADKDLQMKVAQLFGKVLGNPSWSLPPDRKPNAKPRIGFVSRHLSYKHTIGKLLQGIILNLSRDLFDVHVFSIGSENAYLMSGKEHSDDSFYELPVRDLAACKRILTDANLDVLYFTDIGMDVVTYLLAQYRFAPVQCTTWGHPVTTGSPNMDYFISTQHVETPESDAHYTETLIRLENYPFYYYRPILDHPTITRENLGLEAGQTLYACVQSLFKLHPDTDDVFGEILRRDPNGVILLLSHQSDECNSRLYGRFMKRYPEVADRLRFVNRLPWADFLSLMAISDVLLDSIHFSGGNTSYEGLSFGTPIITLATPYMKGRLTVGLYKRMGVTECIAETPEDYINLAVRYGTDADARAQLREKILAHCSVLYEDPAPVRELETVLLKALKARGLYIS
jgi:protein O-GlcNAc transferase